MMLERLDLARINAEIAQTIEMRNQALEVIDWLTGPQSEVVQIQESVAQLRAQYASDRAAWNEAGCPGEPPAEPRDLITQEKALAELRERGGVDHGALGRSKSVAERAGERL